MAYDIHNLTRHPNPAIPPFFVMNPTIGLHQGAHEEASVEISTGVGCLRQPCQYRHLCNTCNGKHLGSSCPSLNSKPTKYDKQDINVTTTLKNQNEIKEQPLPAPISIQHLEAALSGYSDQHFVSQLCNNFKFGVHIGFQGQRTPRFSRNLPTAFANTDIVSSNLAREVSLDRTAGPFDTPPFKNFQVSPIGLVPKKNSNKFRTIFYLSYPKSGSTSINCSIP